jgi:hypothetical protein
LAARNTAGLLDADALALEVGRRLDGVAHHHGGLVFGRARQDDPHRRAFRGADDVDRAGRHADVDVAGEHGAVDLDAVFERDGLDRDAFLLEQAEVLRDQHRRVNDVRRRGRHADGEVFGAGHCRGAAHHGASEQRTRRERSLHRYPPWAVRSAAAGQFSFGRNLRRSTQ